MISTQQVTLRTTSDVRPPSHLIMTVDRDAAVEALIHDGRRAYASKHYKNALECFTRAMKRCPCSRGTRRERCTCKDFERVSAENGSIYQEAMYNCKCTVGQLFGKCDNLLHIQALDYRAATFESLKELERARKDAEWILELAPRLPEGYLRLGKIARLQKKSEFAWKVYSAGIEAGLSNNITKDDPKIAVSLADQEAWPKEYTDDLFRNWSLRENPFTLASVAKTPCSYPLILFIKYSNTSTFLLSCKNATSWTM
ncbi:F-box/TPR repeat protein Pof3 [Geosmithia morbida]|uniref:F-box/TPR repeat protein Pof3 n=1 Tax=Geosmithia morbida TaxID=1094350 RepID=A0A9P4Z021_9HYPO|nr:F-box/TPR repeat protein Pof3 [Geosmithia morbida]KAF4125682.1 F-box/TPR repeat protein Pof3 [Geosmithia morbida]